MKLYDLISSALSTSDLPDLNTSVTPGMPSTIEHKAATHEQSTNEQLIQEQFATEQRNTTAYYSQPTNSRPAMALRLVVQARITCNNSVHELEALDSLTDDWNTDFELLETAAVKIRLQCDYATKDVNTMQEALNALIANTLPANAVQGWLGTELELRQESAVTAATEMVRLISQLLADTDHTEQGQLGLKEIELRAQHVLSKLNGLKRILEQLQDEMRATVDEEGQDGVHG